MGYYCYDCLYKKLVQNFVNNLEKIHEVIEMVAIHRNNVTTVAVWRGKENI